MAPLSEFIWAEEECRSGLPESAIREPYSASPVLPRREEKVVLDLICATATPQLSLRFPKDVMSSMFDCSEPADILGSTRGERNIILRVPTGHESFWNIKKF